MRWFGRKAAREAARPFLLRAWGGGASEGWPRSYEAQVREAYLGNPVAQRAVRLVAEGVGSAVVYDASPAPPAGSLLAAPERIVTPSLLEAVAAQLLLHGNAFVRIISDAKGEPAELFALRPERVSVEADASGWPAAYVYKAGETKTRLAARDGLGRPSLVHLKAMHPLDDHYGLGCLGAAAGAVAIHNAATRWNKALLDNAAVIGREIVQFGLAEPIGDRRFRLARILRGRRGTEAASAAHEAGEPFLLLDPESIAIIEPAAGVAGGELWVSAQGIGDGDASVVAKTRIEARALAPPSPVHLRAERLASGDLLMEWVRRSRNGWNWLGGGDTPLVEESESYAVRLSGQGFRRMGRVVQPSFTYTAAQQAEDGSAGTILIEVEQIGTHGSSDPARLNLIHQ